MSIPKRMTVNCSKCGKQLSVTVFESVNSDYADDIAMQIMSGDLFNVECPHCKFVSHLEYDILYHDLRHGAMIWVVHNNSPEYTKRISEIRAIQKPPYKTFRIVEDMNALKEKVSCLESNRDDRIVELCKVFCAYNLLMRKPDFDFKVAFYTAVSGKEMIYLYDNDGDDICCELSDKAYDYLKEIYDSGHYAAQFDDNYPIVDYAWAENILTPLLEKETNNLLSEEEIDNNGETASYIPTNDKKVCPKCKAVLPSDSEFCQECGTKLSASISKEELERQRISEIRKERNFAILKRAAIQEAAGKRKKIINKRIKIIMAILIALVVVFELIFIVNSAKESVYNEQERNIAVEEMNDDFTNVYADVVSFKVEYTVTESKYKNDIQVGPSRVASIICKCTTVEGKEFWLEIPAWAYSETIEYRGENPTSDYDDQYFSEPVRVRGCMTTFGRVVDNAPSYMEDTLILSCDGTNSSID